MQIKQYSVQFTEYLPDELQEGVLYISMEYATASHMCACGCKQEVVTPFSPTDWKLIYNGENVSLSPSIGNWSYTCRSHYFIRNNKVIWAKGMSKQAIESGRRQDSIKKIKHYSEEDAFVVSLNSSTDKSRDLKSTPRTNRFLGALSRLFGFK